MRTTLYLLMACLFSACNTIEYIGIETYNPAEITFPKNVDKVLIVNNAVPQPTMSAIPIIYMELCRTRPVPMRIVLCMMPAIP